jgi:DNA-binding transcriptional MerR regulator
MVSADYTAAELAEAGGITKRNLRAYRQRGLLDPPRMHGRTGYYGPGHLAQLRTVRALLARGLSLSEITGLLRDRGGQAALDVLLSEPPSPAVAGDGRIGRLMPSTVQTLTLQRPGAVDRLTDLGVLHRDERGRLIGDSALLARCNAMLAAGSRVRVISDVAEASGVGAQMVATSLLQIAAENGVGNPQVFIELATFSFREALRHRVSVGTASCS